MRHLQGTCRTQTQLLPPSIEDYIPDDHPVRVIDAFVDSLDVAGLGFQKAETAVTGRRPYHPGDLLKLYLYAYLNQTSSTRRLEKECHRNLEQLAHSETGANEEPELATGKVAEVVAALRSRKAGVEEELQTLEAAGKTQHCRTEADAKLMKSGRAGMVVGYNAQNAVDARHQLIIAHDLTQSSTDNQHLAPMEKTIREALTDQVGQVVADSGYSNGAQVAEVQAGKVAVAVPANRAVNHQGNGGYFQKSEFTYLPEENTYRCPAGELLHYKTLSNKDRLYLYTRTGCSRCPLQARCTKADQCWVSRHFDEVALESADKAATAELMKQRMAVVEPPFGTLKPYLNQGRFTCWGLQAASSEYSLGVLSYNLMRAINILGVKALLAKLA